jgi:hypothetical protein
VEALRLCKVSNPLPVIQDSFLESIFEVKIFTEALDDLERDVEEMIANLKNF